MCRRPERNSKDKAQFPSDCLAKAASLERPVGKPPPKNDNPISFDKAGISNETESERIRRQPVGLTGGYAVRPTEGGFRRKSESDNC